MSEDGILAFIEGRLADDENGQANEHLASCAGCRQLVMHAIQTSTTMRSSTGGGAFARARMGRYQLLDVVGRGAMGDVFAAYDPELDRKVALKLLRSDVASTSVGQQRLLREARAIAKLAHPNVVAVHDVGTHDGAVFLAMEFVRGTTLSVWLDGRRSVEDIIDAFLQAGRGLAAAHDAGIVHRDFKPANVLVGDDGRVRVSDFGLARHGDAVANERADTGSTAIDALELTQTGALVGTPAFMAPEQLEGHSTTDKSDQYAFATAMYRGLVGRLPFDADTVAALIERKRERKLDFKNAQYPVTAATQKALARGLSVVPSERFSSMDEMLETISPARRRTALGAVASAALATLAVAGALVGYGVWGEDDGAQMCAGSEHLMADTWNQHSQRELDDRFSAMRGGASTWRVLRAALDDYSNRWVAAHRVACEDTRVHGSQTEAQLELRMRCLERRRHSFESLVERLQRVAEQDMHRAADAALDLPSLALCENIDALSERVPWPTDPARRRQVRDLADDLSAFEAVVGLVDGSENEVKATALVERAESVAFAPLHAEALLYRGRVAHHEGDYESAETALLAAVERAEAGRDDLMKARAMTELVYVVGYYQANIASGLEWGRLARAALERAGGDEVTRARLLTNIALVNYKANDYQAALDVAKEALAIRERTLGSDHLHTAVSLNDIGIFHSRAGNHAQAMDYLQRGLSIRERLLGKQHPQVARSLGNIGNAHGRQGNLEAALDYRRRHLAIQEASYGSDHIAVGGSLENLAFAEMKLKHWAAAEKHLRRAYAIRKDTAGGSELALAKTAGRLGYVLAKLDRYDKAAPFIELELTALEKQHGADSVKVARSAALLADVLWELGQRKRAVALARKSHATLISHEQDAGELESWLKKRNVATR